jgi:broad specificity phosphatase PhoE
MTRLALIRHGATPWNETGRLQGRADPGLSADTVRWLASAAAPEELGGARWIASPLQRAIETARILSGEEPVIEARLTEMDWGDWEGRTLADLRAKLTDSMAANEARGRDFRPTCGESPRDVQARIRPWLGEVAGQDRPTIAVTHKGVIRAVLGLATGWDMKGPAPLKLDWKAVHLFHVSSSSEVAVDRVNLPLCGREARAP